MVNGRIDKYQFEEGYCQAEKSSSDKSKDNFTFCYYDQDHLGNIRQVREANGSKGDVIQTMNYYPFGAEFCDGGTKNYTQKHKYNGKEFDNMHGLNSYDYGARQYNPVTARWDRVDPLAEKYYSVSPYNYCNNNPVNSVDPDGRDVCVLTAPKGAGNLGHMAILIQRPNKDGVKQWFLYSKNGTSENKGFSGHSDKDDIKKGVKGNNSEIGFNTVEEFLQSDKNLNNDGTVEYTEGYLLSCDSDKDIKAEQGAIEYLGKDKENKDYNLLNRNCAQTVQNALSKSGFKTGQPSLRLTALRMMGGGSGSDISDRFPNVIYQRIK